MVREAEERLQTLPPRWEDRPICLKVIVAKQ